MLGNYATDASAGATYRYQLLVMVLASNIIAVYLQTLCVKLGTVTGLNLAESIKENCPPWMNYFLYFFAEAAIIATDIAEVIASKHLDLVSIKMAHSIYKGYRYCHCLEVAYWRPIGCWLCPLNFRCSHSSSIL